MNYNNPQQKTAAPAIIIVCAVVFLLFSFCWLYRFQADVLAVAQHVLSDGQTSYNPFVGAVLITVILFIVQQGVYAVLRLNSCNHALTYFPSFLLLAMVSGLAADNSGHISMGKWLWLFPLLMVLWGGFVWFSKQVVQTECDTSRSGPFSRHTWRSTLLMCGMMLMVALFGSTNAVYHYRVHAEMALNNGNPDEALRAGARSAETDESLTMLRLYALSQKGLIGDSLFSYPVCGTSNDMLPLKDSRSRLLLYPVDSLWSYFGSVRPSEDMTVHEYLDALSVDSLSTSALRDYRLSAMLIDRQLDSFVVALPSYYPVVPDSLPRHYREALVLYYYNNVSDSTLRASCSDSLMIQRWQDFSDLRDQYSRNSEQQLRILEHFGRSYWTYYLFK